MMTSCRDKSGNFWQRDSAGPLIEIDWYWNHAENFPVIGTAWQNDMLIIVTTDEDQQICNWIAANVLRDYTED